MTALDWEGPMFERLTDRGRQVVVLAHDFAAGLNHASLGTEHLLVGLLDEGEGVAARALIGSGVNRGAIVREITTQLGIGDRPVERRTWTPTAKKVLELALREALSLGHNYIGTEHILLGLIRSNGGFAGHMLAKRFNVDLAKVREEVIRLLSSPRTHVPARRADDEAFDQALLDQFSLRRMRLAVEADRFRLRLAEIDEEVRRLEAASEALRREAA